MRNKANILFVVCTLLLSSYSMIGQSSVQKITDLKVTLKLENQALGTVLQALMEEYDIPIGFEQSILDRSHSEYAFHTNLPAIASTSKSEGGITLTTSSRNSFEAKSHLISLNADNASLSVVLDDIVKQMKNYVWSLNDGVVNIYPINGRDKRFERLLEMKVSHFKVESGKTVEDITLAIVALPEFRNYIKEEKFHIIYIRKGMDFEVRARYGRPLNRGLEFTNITFRELLNRATVEKRGGWILRWNGIGKQSGKEFIDLDI